MNDFFKNRQADIVDRFTINAIDIIVNFILSLLFATTSFIVGYILSKYHLNHKNVFFSEITLEDMLFNFEIGSIVAILSCSVLSVVKENILYLVNSR